MLDGITGAIATGHPGGMDGAQMVTAFSAETALIAKIIAAMAAGRFIIFDDD
jgi:acetyl-CoA acetyltransferase